MVHQTGYTHAHARCDEIKKIVHLRVHVGGMERVGGNVGRPLAIVRASVTMRLM